MIPGEYCISGALSGRCSSTMYVYPCMIEYIHIIRSTVGLIFFFGWLVCLFVCSYVFLFASFLLLLDNMDTFPSLSPYSPSFLTLLLSLPLLKNIPKTSFPPQCTRKRKSVLKDIPCSPNRLLLHSSETMKEIGIRIFIITLNSRVIHYGLVSWP